MSPGLPGMDTEMSPSRGVDQISRWTMLVSSPTNFFANEGTPEVRCHWSMVTCMPSPTGSITTVLRITPWKSQTSSRNAGSASIAATASAGAS